jgi:lipoyl(octanoyl) transferase
LRNFADDSGLGAERVFNYEITKLLNYQMISLIQLGTVDYALGLRLQEQLVALRKEEKIGDVLLLLEHKPVITLGRNAKVANVVASPELLKKRGVELFECDRGGDVTFHGPGQIVGYPIFDLRGFAPGLSNDYVGTAAPESTPRAKSRGPVERSSTVRKHLGAVEFVRRLEEVLIRTCADFAIPTKRIAGLTGVWTDSTDLSSRAQENDSKNRSLESRDLLFAGSATDSRAEAKLAAIGIHISHSVTSHGFALNVNTDLSFFNLIIPCGITSKPVTSMQLQLGKEPDLNAVAESISRNFGTVFSSQMLWVETLDALLGRTVGVPMQPPAELRKLHTKDDTAWG